MITDSNLFDAASMVPEFKSFKIYTLPTLHKLNLLWQGLPNITKLTRNLRKIGPDFVHLHVQHHYVPAIALSHLQFMLGSWGSEVLKLPQSDFFSKSLAKMVATKARAITVDAECLKNIWIELGIPKTKIAVIPFGVDTRIFNPKVDGQPVRERLQIDKEDVVVISTRWFRSPHYNVECLIRAVPSVVRKFKNVKFIVKGSGPLEIHLKNLSEKLGVAKYVRFFGLVPYEEMPRFLSAADIYISTSFVDSTSVSLLEAMACGIAPIVTNIPGNREWVEDCVNGLLFPPKDEALLAEKIIYLVENQKLRDVFGRRCVDTVKKRATWEHCVSKMQAIYETLLKR